MNLAQDADGQQTDEQTEPRLAIDSRHKNGIILELFMNLF